MNKIKKLTLAGLVAASLAGCANKPVETYEPIPNVDMQDTIYVNLKDDSLYQKKDFDLAQKLLGTNYKIEFVNENYTSDNFIDEIESELIPHEPLKDLKSDLAKILERSLKQDIYGIEPDLDKLQVMKRDDRQRIRGVVKAIERYNR